MESVHAAIAVMGMAACGLAVWWPMRRRMRKDPRPDPALPEDPVHMDTASEGKLSDTPDVLESLRRQLREGDIAAQDGGDDSISLPFLETEPRHHEVEGASEAAEEPFLDTVPTFSWTRDDD